LSPRDRVVAGAYRVNGEEWVEKTTYFTVEVYGAKARAFAAYLAKGSRRMVDAELDWREWTDQQKNRREAVTLRVYHAALLYRTVVRDGFQASGRPLSKVERGRR
jgi:single-stranded DNA-binding protein